MLQFSIAYCIKVIIIQFSNMKNQCSVPCTNLKANWLIPKTMQESFLWKSCGALVNNRTSGPVPEGLQFSRSDHRLWYKIVKWACCFLTHPMAAMQNCPPAYESCLSKIQRSPSGSFPVTLKIFWRIIVKWAWCFRSSPLTTCTSMQESPIQATPMQATLMLVMPTILWNPRWSRPQLSPSAGLVPETLWKNKQTIYLVLPF